MMRAMILPADAELGLPAGFAGRERIGVVVFVSLLIVGMLQQCLAAHVVMFDFFVSEQQTGAQLSYYDSFAPVIAYSHEKLINDFMVFNISVENHGPLLHSISIFYKILFISSLLAIFLCFLPKKINPLKAICILGAGYFAVGTATLLCFALYFWNVLFTYDSLVMVLVHNPFFFYIFLAFLRFDKAPQNSLRAKNPVLWLCFFYSVWGIYMAFAYENFFNNYLFS